MRQRIRGIGYILIAIGTLGLILNAFIMEGSAIRTFIFAGVDIIGLACLIYGRFWQVDRTDS
jgi:hypothetical protein